MRTARMHLLLDTKVGELEDAVCDFLIEKLPLDNVIRMQNNTQKTKEGADPNIRLQL